MFFFSSSLFYLFERSNLFFCRKRRGARQAISSGSSRRQEHDRPGAPRMFYMKYDSVCALCARASRHQLKPSRTYLQRLAVSIYTLAGRKCTQCLQDVPADVSLTGTLLLTLLRQTVK